MLVLKNHYVGCYWHLRKTFLNYLEDSMSQDSLIGLTISTRSQKNISCASKISSPSVLSQDTKMSRESEKLIHMTFTLRILIMHFYQNQILKSIEKC